MFILLVGLPLVENFLGLVLEEIDETRALLRDIFISGQ
jgi:hypothetical protein